MNTRDNHKQVIIKHLTWRESVCLGRPTTEQLGYLIGMSDSYACNLVFEIERDKRIQPVLEMV